MAQVVALQNVRKIYPKEIFMKIIKKIIKLVLKKIGLAMTATVDAVSDWRYNVTGNKPKKKG